MIESAEIRCWNRNLVYLPGWLALLFFVGCTAAGEPVQPQPPKPLAVESHTSTKQNDFEALILQKMEQKVSWRLENETLPAFAARVRRALGVPVLVDKAALDQLDEIDDEILDVSLQIALEHVLRDSELTWTIRGETIAITTPLELEKELVTRVYLVQDLVSGGAFQGIDSDKLTDTIVSHVDSENWTDNGGTGEISAVQVGDAKVLVVSQTLRGHLQVVQLLADLRAVRNVANSAGPSTMNLDQLRDKLPVLNNPLLTQELSGGATSRDPDPLKSFIPNSPELHDAVLHSNQFNLDLFRRAAVDRDKNQLVSGYSAREVLALASFGSTGETRRELASGTGLASTNYAAAIELLSIRSQIVEKAASGSEFRVANGLWLHQPFSLNAYFASLAADFMSASARRLDFAQGDQAAAEINRWAAENTNGRIPQIVRGTDVVPSNPLLLTNAVYFLGKWDTAFDAAQTKERDFNLFGGQTIKAPTMDGKVLARSGQDDESGLQIAELPYRGRTKSMVILLPASGEQAFGEMEKTLTAETLVRWLSALHEGELHVQLPKFTFAADYDLGPSLKELGVRNAFDPTTADFSGLSDGPLFLQQIRQNTFIKVDETGTEAAAVTGGFFGGERPEAPITDFIADRQFLFLIRDVKTGCILFIGRVVDPR